MSRAERLRFDRRLPEVKNFSRRSSSARTLPDDPSRVVLSRRAPAPRAGTREPRGTRRRFVSDATPTRAPYTGAHEDGRRAARTGRARRGADDVASYFPLRKPRSSSIDALPDVGLATRARRRRAPRRRGARARRSHVMRPSRASSASSPEAAAAVAASHEPPRRARSAQTALRMASFRRAAFAPRACQPPRRLASKASANARQPVPRRLTGGASGSARVSAGALSGASMVRRTNEPRA